MAQGPPGTEDGDDGLVPLLDGRTRATPERVRDPEDRPGRGSTGRHDEARLPPPLPALEGDPSHEAERSRGHDREAPRMVAGIRDARTEIRPPRQRGRVPR